MKYLLCAFFLLYFYNANAIDTIRTRGPQSEFDASHSYFIGLIKLAYQKNNKEVNLVFSPYMAQKRALSELQADRIVDIYWAGMDAARASQLSVVNIPLIKGLLGFRVFITHQDNLEKLEQVSTLSDLRKVSLCQGSHWPDTDIMLASGLNILPNPIYENMFSQTYIKRCDAFPRGIHEARSEYQARKIVMPELALYQDLILHYPFPMYFFTSAKNSQLANFIQTGLEKAIDDGSFEQFMRTHPTTKHLFPLEIWQNARFIYLENPFLPEGLDTKDPRYWIYVN
ncbi:MAG: hypothetical protein HRT53_01805 [Colwellia sp.]|nr:hypothetical protein [Colwellia sp.]